MSVLKSMALGALVGGGIGLSISSKIDSALGDNFHTAEELFPDYQTITKYGYQDTNYYSCSSHFYNSHLISADCGPAINRNLIPLVTTFAGTIIGLIGGFIGHYFI